MKKFLIVEDDNIDAQILKRQLQKELKDSFECLRASCLKEAVDTLKSENVDIIFLDIGLPDALSLEDSVSRLYQLSPHTPLIVLTGDDNLEQGVLAVKLGAQDYLVKGDISSGGVSRCVEFSFIRKNVERELIYQKEEAFRKSEFKSLFLASMSHDLRAPLMAIINVVPELKNRDLSPEQVTDFYDILEKAGETQLRIINDILDLTKLEQGSVKVHEKEMDLRKIVNSTVIPLRHLLEMKGLDFKVIIDDEVASRIICDEVCVTRILGNLVNNAYKFTEEGEVKVHVFEKDSELIFKVSDSGQGISKADQESIFNTFDQGSHGERADGVGLGLSICRQRIGLLKGRIWVESEVGKGSDFYFSVPYKPVKSPLKPIEATADIKIRAVKPRRILFFEDDPCNEKLIELYLKGADYSFVVAKNGRDGLDLFKNSHFDMVFVDLRMPDILGYEVVHLLRELEKKEKRHRSIIVGFTASAVDKEVELLTKAGCDSLLLKPYRKVELLQKITGE